MAQIVFDTSVLLAISLGGPSAEDAKRSIGLVAEGKDTGLISTIVIAEVIEKACRIGKREAAISFLNSLKESGFFVVEVTEEIAKLAGPLKAKFPQISTADAIIASTAHVNGAKLYTFDKGFYGIGDVDIIGI